jgi:hypothetical protein
MAERLPNIFIYVVERLQQAFHRIPWNFYQPLVSFWPSPLSLLLSVPPSPPLPLGEGMGEGWNWRGNGGGSGWG